MWTKWLTNAGIAFAHGPAQTDGGAHGVYPVCTRAICASRSESSKYALGDSVAALGITMVSISSCGASFDYMQDLANRYDISVSLGIRNGLSVLYVENCRSGRTLSLGVGSERPHPDCGDGHGTRAAGRDGASRARATPWPEFVRTKGQRWPRCYRPSMRVVPTGVRVASQLWCVIGRLILLA